MITIRMDYEVTKNLAKFFPYVVEPTYPDDFDDYKGFDPWGWAETHLGEDGSEGNSTTTRLTVYPERRWTYWTSTFYFRDQKDAALFKLTWG